MPILEERHDFAHRVEADSAWSESYYFNAYDPYLHQLDAAGRPAVAIE